jgi:hypothetical protein
MRLFKVGRPVRPVQLELQNLIIRLDMHTVSIYPESVCFCIIETLSDDLSLTHLKLQNMSIDASLTSNAPLCIRTGVITETIISCVSQTHPECSD